MSQPSEQPSFVVVGSKPWNRRVFKEVICHLPGQWHYQNTPEQVTLEALRGLNPRYVFFLHWSAKVPDEVFSAFECVVFHMTDVPYGRGGSPLQNLIARGHRETKLSALRMTRDFDAGPVYYKEGLSLEGGAEEILIRATTLSAHLIERIVRERPEPTPQAGEAIVFKRRRPSESEIQEQPSLQSLHDFLRMLDADGYPRAFLTHGGFRYEFSRAALYDGRIVADVTITPVQETTP